MKVSTKTLTVSALFAALCCVMTMSVRIPVPATNGYIHPGDAMVILSGVFLGPGIGFLAAGIGSALADLFAGYTLYVPITFLIKGLIAFSSGILFYKLGKNEHMKLVSVALGGITDIILVAVGYFVFEYFIYGVGAAASIPANLIQGASGLVIATILYPVLNRIFAMTKQAYC